MSHQTFQDMWAECVQELMEQVQIEYLPSDAAEQGHAYDTGFEHSSLLYIKYMQIYRKLETCYDQMVHPQKRRDIRKILETVIVRILELKEELIKWNRRTENHIVPLDEVLTDLKLNPETVDWQVPRFFTDDQDIADEIEVREKRIKHWLESHRMPLEPDDLTDKKDPFQVDLTIEAAIRIIQKNERGRIGIQRAQMVSDWRRDAMRKEERNKRAAEKQEHEDPFDQQVLAATMIAAHWKRRVDRKRFQRMREEEFQFLGMAAPPPPAPEIDQVKLLAGIRTKRKKMQQDAEDEFAKALREAEEWVRTKKGPDMMAQRKLYCREWILRQRKQSQPPKLPNDLTLMYEEEKGEGEPVEEDPKAADPKAKDAKKDAKGEEDAEVRKTGTTDTVAQILTHINEYEAMWEGRGERGANFEQRVDLELARMAVYPKVEADIRTQVDQMITEELQNLIKIYEKAQKKGKKEKKGKKGGKKEKKGKAKLKKWCAAVGMITNRDVCVPDLVKEGILKLVAPAHFTDFLGEFAYMGQVQRVQEQYAVAPSAQMIKSLIVEHCVLPLASLHVRQRLKPEMTARALLLYGPRGTGKSMLARAIATEAGARFFDISPHVIEGLYPHPKTGADLLVYKVLCVAQDLAPSIIYIDNVEQVFKAGGKKKKAVNPDDPSRIKKVLIAARNQIKRGAESLAEDRVLIVGVTHQPFFEGVSTKDLIDAFDFKVWCSFPDCGSRVMLIHKFIEASGVIVDPAKLNISALSIAADGYSAGSLRQTVQRVLTARRIQQLKNRPLQVQEFLGPLSRTHFSWPEDWLQFREFDHEASGEKARIEEMQNKLQKLEGAEDPKKKK